MKAKQVKFGGGGEADWQRDQAAWGGGDVANKDQERGEQLLSPGWPGGAALPTAALGIVVIATPRG
eukprot:SAG22_NODE_110_length_19679_cov_45.046527_4_plen_66_part_00